MYANVLNTDQKDVQAYSIDPKWSIQAIIDLPRSEFKIADCLALKQVLQLFAIGEKCLIQLSGACSLENLANLLGFGVTNIQRVRQAIKGLIAASILKKIYDSKRNVILDLDLSKDKFSKVKNSMKKDHKIKIVDNGKSKESFRAKVKNPSSTGIYINNEEINNNIITSSLYFEEEEKKSTVENKSISENSKRLNEVDEILESYAKAFVPTCLKNDIPAKQRLNFRNEYLTSGKSKSSSIAAVNALKVHPYKSNKITSPMAIFHAEIMLRCDETKFYMSKAKAAVDDWKAEKLDIDIIKSFAINNSFDWPSFKTYFKIE